MGRGKIERRENSFQASLSHSLGYRPICFPWGTFLLLSFAYFSLACLRKAITISIPAMLKTETLEITKSDFGFISSSFSASFGLSKFVGSLASDFFPAKYLLCGSLLISSLSSLLFSSTNSATIFALSWSAHGFGQGSGWPPISQMIYTYFEPGTRGTVWSIITSVAVPFPPLQPTHDFSILTSLDWKYRIPSRSSALDSLRQSTRLEGALISPSFLRL
jgi:hypothetical protein